MPTKPITARFQAAETVFSVQADYADRGQNLANAALAGSSPFVEWAHYPAADLLDKEVGTLAYYHAHEASERLANEHGHFHVFVPSSNQNGRYSHLIGISLNARGEALRLFTTNRWVTAEHWEAAAVMDEALSTFRFSTRGRLAPVSRWLNGMVTLFADEISGLLIERDALMNSLIEKNGREAALEDRSLHIVSQCPIDVPAKLLATEVLFNTTP